MQQNENLPNPSYRKRSVTIGEAIGFVISIGGALIAIYTQTQLRLSALELRMNEKEKADQVYIISLIK